MSSDESDRPTEIAERIIESFDDEYSDYDMDKLTEKVERFTSVKGIDDSEIQRAVTTSVMDDLGVDRDELLSGSGGGSRTGEVVPLTDAFDAHPDTDDDEGAWVNLEVTVDQLWEPNHDSIAQTGLIADETARTKFTAWKNNEVPALEEGASYRLESVVTDEYNGDINIKFTPNTEVEELDESIENSSDGIEVVGCLVDLQSGSGLIKRCTEEDEDGEECGRALRNDQCGEHGDVEGDHDLRLMAVIDTGEDIYEVVVGSELTAELTGIDKDEAVDMAMDALDMTVVGEAMRERVLGRYYRAEGPKIGRYLNADEMELVDEVSYDEDLLIKARSMQE